MPTRPSGFLSVMKNGLNGIAPSSDLDRKRVERLEIYAEPYGIMINASTTEYIIHLKPKMQGTGVGIARKIISREEVDRADCDSETYLADHIFNMKYELGWRGNRVNKSYVDGEIRRREQMRIDAEGQARSAAQVVIDGAIGIDPVPVAKKKPNRPRCSEHGNELEPREVGVLGCPIPGCTMELRKKAVVGAAFKRVGDVAPPPVGIVPSNQTGSFIEPPDPPAVSDLPIELIRVPIGNGWALKQGDSVIYLNRYAGEKIIIARDRKGMTDATVEISVRPTGTGTDIVTW